MDLRLDGKQADAGAHCPAVRQHRILRNFQRTGNAPGRLVKIGKTGI